MRRLSDRPIDVAALVAATEDDGSGALVVFVGTVRDDGGEASVEAITYTAQAPLCEAVLAEIERETAGRTGVRRCAARHRVGRLAVGEASVAVVVRAAHRAEAFDAARAAIDEIKRRAPIWKEEHLRAGGSRRPPGVPLAGRHAAADGPARQGDAGGPPSKETTPSRT